MRWPAFKSRLFLACGWPGKIRKALIIIISYEETGYRLRLCSLIILC